MFKTPRVVHHGNASRLVVELQVVLDAPSRPSVRADARDLLDSLARTLAGRQAYPWEVAHLLREPSSLSSLLRRYEAELLEVFDRALRPPDETRATSGEPSSRPTT